MRLRVLIGLPLLLGLAACGGGIAPAGAPTTGTAPGWTVPALAAAQPISRQEYAQRRAALAAGLQDGVFIAYGAEEPDADYLPFAQNSPFRYLTGITEAGAALVMEKRGGQVTERLFVLPRNPAREVWEGARLGAERAETLTGIQARTVEALRPAVDSMLARGARTLYTLSTLPEDARAMETLTHEQQLIRAIADAHPGTQVVSVDDQLQRIRATKTPTELDLIRRAIYITNLAQRAAMRTIEPGMNEFEVQAVIEYTFRRHGAERPSFATIVGSGPNSTTLHYRADDRFMNADDVVVMDIGASYRGYAADVTRTVPVSGTFSPEQRAIYEIVLAAQKAAEALARPGATWAELNQAANAVLGEGLARLGLIDSPTATYECDNARVNNQCPQLRLFYMHGLGHGIGLDVHDPDISYFDAFRVGSAFSIEPGIYVRADALDYLKDTPANQAMIARLRPALERYRNIGVRIEDDYFITETGVERISEGAPREVAEIEALMAQPSPWVAERRPEVVEWYRQSEPR